ncbi:hypothetical protein ACFYT4_33880 [Streptomyces sp. NPDC004609]|uniref:hypothetical protein n=1 Tax=Streptomyces sp. NPDC004609 TaxID=3364704 RepID=UPI0036CD5F9D
MEAHLGLVDGRQSVTDCEAIRAFQVKHEIEPAEGDTGLYPRHHASLDADRRPVTALPGPDTGEPCEDTFALEALGRVLVTSLRTWAQAGPDAAEDIARAVIDFTAQILTDDHEDVADIPRQLEAVGVRQALDAHTPHRPVRTTARRCTAPRAPPHRASQGAPPHCTRCAPCGGGSYITQPLDRDLIDDRYQG